MELRRLQENLRARCRNDGDAVEALNAYAAAKTAIGTLREAFSQARGIQKRRTSSISSHKIR